MSDGFFSGLVDKLQISDIQLNSLSPANKALNTKIELAVGMGAAKPGFLKPVTLGVAEEFSKKTSAMMCEVNKMCADLAAITPTTALAKNDAAAAATASVPLNELLAQNDSDPRATTTKAEEKAEKKADREAGEKQADRLAKNASDHEKLRAKHADAAHAKEVAREAEQKREAAV